MAASKSRPFDFLIDPASIDCRRASSGRDIGDGRLRIVATPDERAPSFRGAIFSPPVNLTVITHVPNPGQVMQRYYGWYASRARWAEWFRRIVEVDPLTCPRCQGVMRVVAVITDATVIGRILAHRVRARNPTAQPRSPLRLRRPPTPTAAGRPHP